jgi:hypothetical protein
MKTKTRKSFEKLEYICELCRKDNDIDGDMVAYTYKRLGILKAEDKKLTKHAAITLQEDLRQILYLVLQYPFDSILLNIGNYKSWFDIIDNKVMYIDYFIPNQSIEVIFKNENGNSIKKNAPYLLHHVFILLSNLPINTLRICKSDYCGNLFASQHKSKRYCSPRCRNRENTYNARQKIKEKIKGLKK